MEYVNAIFLGVIQGLTEFIPVSSSGHLVLARALLGEQVAYGLSFDAVLQLATTFAVIVYFWKDIVEYIQAFFRVLAREPIAPEQKTMLIAILLGSIPAGVLGFLFEDVMDTVFRSPLIVAGTLLIGAMVMFLAERVAKQTKTLSVQHGFFVGMFQALALIPGFSRSGMTIAGGLFLGITREAATRFSFLLALPLLTVSGLKKLFDLYALGLVSSIGGELVVGSVVAFVVGLGAIHFLVSFLKKNTLMVFVWYRVVLAIVLLLVLLR
jgi:undecaprenyl-diphosphatase